MELLATWAVPGYLTDTVALASVALLGYLVGLWARRKPLTIDERFNAELSRAVRIAKDLQQVAGRIRKEVALHQSSIAQFQTRVESVKNADRDEAWHTLTGEAEALLAPTMKLATNLSAAYDQLRQHSSQLRNFAGSRTDPETGVGNRRALEEHLDTLFAAYQDAKSRFSLALFSVEPPTLVGVAQVSTSEVLCRFAELLENSARDTDFVARYSNDEFVVLMAQTTLAGAGVFSERLVRRVGLELDYVVSGGIVEVQPGDSSAKLLSRADSALYSARSNGCSCLFVHNGKSLRELEMAPPEVGEDLPVVAVGAARGDLAVEGWEV